MRSILLSFFSLFLCFFPCFPLFLFSFSFLFFRSFFFFLLHLLPTFAMARRNQGLFQTFFISYLYLFFFLSFFSSFFSLASFLLLPPPPPCFFTLPSILRQSCIMWKQSTWCSVLLPYCTSVHRLTHVAVTSVRPHSSGSEHLLSLLKQSRGYIAPGALGYFLTAAPFIDPTHVAVTSVRSLSSGCELYSSLHTASTPLMSLCPSLCPSFLFSVTPTIIWT